MKVKRLYDDAKLPYKGDPDDEGFDLYVHSKTYDNYGNVVYGSGIAIELEEGYFADLRARSSNSKKDLILSNGIGTIDYGYRGEIMAKFKPSARFTPYGWVIHPSQANQYEIGDRFCQLIIHKREDVVMEEATELSTTQRGEGGYGSTGK